MFGKPSPDFLKSIFIIIFVFGFISNVIFDARAEKEENVDLGAYNISFNVSNDCKIISKEKDIEDLQKNIELRDMDGYWSLYFFIIEDNSRSKIDPQNLGTTLREFLIKKFNLSEEAEIKSTNCTCANYEKFTYMTNNSGKNAYKMWFIEPALKKKIIAFHYYFVKDSKHIIIWTDSNDEKADLICSSSHVSTI